MTIIALCPICRSDSKEVQSGSWGTIEEVYHSCDTCKLYYYEFSYGATRWAIDGVEYYEESEVNQAILSAVSKFNKANPDFKPVRF